MKTKLLLILAALCPLAFAADIKNKDGEIVAMTLEAPISKADKDRFAVPEQGTLTFASSLSLEPMPTTMTFQCGIAINMRTGEVKIPPGMTLAEASREFWKGIKQAYPNAFGAQTADTTTGEPTFNSGITFIATGGDGPRDILVLTGIRQKNTRDPTALDWPQYQRPEKPEEITVTITTSDGRKWRAKWEEVKP